ncbi:MAG: hypothetical protein ACTSRZ_17730 [Promethearchaeota archaeon]
MSLEQQKSRKDLKQNLKEVFLKYKIYFGYILAYILTLALIFSPFWQLVIIAGIIGGLCVPNTRKGSKIGAIGIMGAWATYIIIKILTSDISTLMNQVAVIIFGGENLGFLMFILIIFLGGIIGSFGGVIGAAIRTIITPPEEVQDKELEEKDEN